MAAFDRILDGIKEVLRATDEIKRLSEGVKMLAIEIRDIDCRWKDFVVEDVQVVAGIQSVDRAHHQSLQGSTTN